MVEAIYPASGNGAYIRDWQLLAKKKKKRTKKKGKRDNDGGGFERLDVFQEATLMEKTGQPDLA